MDINIIKLAGITPVVICLLGMQFLNTRKMLRNICFIITVMMFLVCASVGITFDSHAVITETNKVLNAKETAFDSLESGNPIPIYDTILVDDPVDERIENVKIRWDAFYHNVYILYRYKGE
jgi:hypothetical protein